jgi:hypothetical protein
VARFLRNEPLVRFWLPQTHASHRNFANEVLPNGSAGREFVASVNAGIRCLVPSAVMESARDQVSGLLFRNSRDTAVDKHSQLRFDSASVRARSRNELQEYCRLRGIKERHLCPCGSGEKLRFCCAEALRDWSAWAPPLGRIVTSLDRKCFGAKSVPED